MASSTVSLPLRHRLDPATVAYLQDLVNAIQGRCFHVACDAQIAAVDDPTVDLFRLRPEPSLLAAGGVLPDEVTSAIATIEDLLQQGSPFLAAYERAAVRIRRAQTEEAFGAAVSELFDANSAVTNYLDAFAATRAHLAANQNTINYFAAQVQLVPVTASSASPAPAAVILGDVASVAALMWCQQREQMLWIVVSRMTPHYLAALRRHQITLARVEAAHAAMDAVPSYLPPGGGYRCDELRVIGDGARLFEESVAVLSEFMA